MENLVKKLKEELYSNVWRLEEEAREWERRKTRMIPLFVPFFKRVAQRKRYVLDAIKHREELEWARKKAVAVPIFLPIIKRLRQRALYVLAVLKNREEIKRRMTLAVAALIRHIRRKIQRTLYVTALVKHWGQIEGDEGWEDRQLVANISRRLKVKQGFLSIGVACEESLMVNYRKETLEIIISKFFSKKRFF